MLLAKPLDIVLLYYLPDITIIMITVISEIGVMWSSIKEEELACIVLAGLWYYYLMILNT